MFVLFFVSILIQLMSLLANNLFASILVLLIIIIKKDLKSLNTKMAGVARLELTTFGFGDRRSTN